MLFKLITTETDWDNLADKWSRLLPAALSHVPFLEFDYLRTWWQTRGGGEYRPEDSHLRLVIATRDDLLVGIAPLFSTKTALGQSVLMFIGSIEVSDYLDLVVRPEDAAEFTQGLVQFLASDPRTKGHLVSLYNIPASSPTTDTLKTFSENQGISFHQETLQPCPHVSLPPDWEGYLSNLDKKQRHEIRRKIRRAEESPNIVDWYMVHEASNVRTEMQAFIEMMAKDPQKDQFLTPNMRKFLLDLAPVLHQNGWLNLSFLTVDGQKAAAYLCIHYDNQLWVYNSAWDQAFAEFSPGWVLLGYLVQWAIEQGIQAVDFMRGDEVYKYRFGGRDRQINLAQFVLS